MLGSTFVGYNFGVAGPFWFAAGYVQQVPTLDLALGSKQPSVTQKKNHPMLMHSLQNRCSPMIVFFAVLGIACKMRIPEAHTLLEIVRIRYGVVAHGVWIFLCLINNIIAVANMLLGASAAISAL